MEVLAFGAQPVTVTNAVSCEMEPTGREIIRGVEDELRSASVDRVTLTGSTEENFPSQMTALGISVVGYLEGEGRWNPSRPGDLVYCVGRPKVGGEIDLANDQEIVSYEDLRALRQLEGLREVIPAGSKGVAYEAGGAAAYNGLRFVPVSSAIDLDRSAGPATCAVAIVDPSQREAVERLPRAVLIGSMEE